MFWVIHKDTHSDQITIQPCSSMEKLETYLNLMSLDVNDYAVIQGAILKYFNNDSINFSKIRNV